MPVTDAQETYTRKILLQVAVRDMQFLVQVSCTCVTGITFALDSSFAVSICARDQQLCGVNVVKDKRSNSLSHEVGDRSMAEPRQQFLTNALASAKQRTIGLNGARASGCWCEKQEVRLPQRQRALSCIKYSF